MVVAVDMCVVVRHDTKGTGQMIDGGMSNKIRPSTELQILATVTMLVREIIVRHVAHLKCKCAATPPPAGDYVISTSQMHPNCHCRSSGEAANDR